MPAPARRLMALQQDSPRRKPGRRRPLPTWLPWRPRTVALPGKVGTSSANSRTSSYSGVKHKKRKGTSRRRWRRRSGCRRRGKDNKAASDEIHATTSDQLRQAVADEKLHKTLLDRAAAAVAAATAETNAKRAQREAARVPVVRAADAAGKPTLPRREWKPSQRHVEALVGLARDLAASAPFSAAAASSAEAAAEAARSSAAAAAAALRVTPSTVTATISVPAATPSAPAVSIPPRPPPVHAATTTAPTSTPVAVGPEAVGDDPVVARMRRQIELYKMVQASCPGMSQ